MLKTFHSYLRRHIFERRDKFTLAGKRGEKLLGALSSEAKEVFKEENGSQKAEDVKYKMEFVGLD